MNSFRLRISFALLARTLRAQIRGVRQSLQFCDQVGEVSLSWPPMSVLGHKRTFAPQ
jgi:hypothetical protein